MLKVQFSRGNLKEETHYYPYGLPMAGRGGTASGFLPNRRKYQSNEYIQDAGLDWMDFHARQYDPQLGRFMGIDPLADDGGQERLSPYAAMGNNPVSATDPLGLQYQDRADPRFPSEPLHPQYVPLPGSLFNMLATGQMRGFSITWFDGSSFTALVAYANSLAGINDATMGDDKTKKNTNNNGSSQGSAAGNYSDDNDCTDMNAVYVKEVQITSTRPGFWTKVSWGIQRALDAIGQLFTRIGTPGHDNPAINDKEYKKGKGGIVFQGDGQGQEARSAEFTDNLPVQIQDFMDWWGMYGGSGGFGNFSTFNGRLENFVNAAVLMRMALDRAYDGGMSGSLSQYKIYYITNSGGDTIGVGAKTGPGVDTNGLGNALDSANQEVLNNLK